jgi:uncharacterized membrane protein
MMFRLDLKSALLALGLQATAFAFSGYSLCIHRRTTALGDRRAFYQVTQRRSCTKNNYNNIGSENTLMAFSQSDRNPQGFTEFPISLSLFQPFASIVLLVSLLCTPTECALAVDIPFIRTSTSTLLSALTTYGHIFGLLLAAASLMAERLLVKADMSLKEEAQLTTAHAVYGVSNILIVVSGYYLILNGKGWDFYSHEPLFWFKLTLYSIMLSSSFFPTIKILQRYFDRGTIPPPMSSKLANRIVKVVDSELSALASIPLLGTLMSRGVAYVDDFPWPAAGALPLLVVFLGLGFTYVKEALLWIEE